MKSTIADLDKIKNILEKSTVKDVSKGTGISTNTIKKLKSGERSIEKLNLIDAIKITEYANSNFTAKIDVWQKGEG